MKIGFIGLGTMGGSMSLNIRKAGYEMVVNDVRREASARQIEMGCQWADSPREVAAASEIVFTSLPGPPEVEAVALGEDGLLAGMAPGTVWFDLSTNSPTLIRRLHAVFAEKGVHLLDAPVSGGARGARTGELAIWVGGDEELFKRHKEVLDAFGDQARYIGPIGAGSVAKLVHNSASQIIQAGLTEVFLMGVKAGVPPLDLWDAIRHGATGRRRSFDRLADGFLQGKFDPPSFAMKLAHKDMTLATELGRELGIPMRIANLVYQEMTEAVNRGWGDRDSRVSTLLQEERTGIFIEEPPEKIEEVGNRD
jgi:3-hydroxyisobutyrate dehydrogenase